MRFAEESSRAVRANHIGIGRSPRPGHRIRRLLDVTRRYRLLYRLGITPWEVGHASSELTALLDGPDAPSPERALDIGCGTGTQAIHLAQRGWRVTAVDAVKRPLDAARRRAREAGVSVDWRQADVGELPQLGLEPGFALLHDRGCFHELPEATRSRYVDGVTSLAASGAPLLLLAFVPGRRFAAPSGADEDELRARFAGNWDLVAVLDDSGPDPPGPTRHVRRRWYHLVRR